MLVGITKLEPQKLDEEKFETHDIVPIVEFDTKKNEMDGGMIVMQVIMNAIGLLTKN